MSRSVSAFPLIAFSGALLATRATAGESVDTDGTLREPPALVSLGQVSLVVGALGAAVSAGRAYWIKEGRKP